jgi:hypothetical protein
MKTLLRDFFRTADNLLTLNVKKCHVHEIWWLPVAVAEKF